MMKKLMVVLVALMAALMALEGALAQTILFENDTVTVEATNAEGEPLEPVTTDTLALLGLDDEGRAVIYLNEAIAYATPEALKKANAGLAGFDLPVLSELAPIQRGADREQIRALQQALIDLGYLQGEADGSFGNMSANAVTSFQRAVGLPATGSADGLTQQLLFALAGDPVTLSAYTDPAQQFAAIADRTDAKLEALYGKGMKFEYDDISGSGFISNGAQLTAVGEGADIDSYEFTFSFGFAVAESKGVVTVKPVIQVTNVSVRRPLMATALLKSGDQRLSAKVSGIANSVSGSKSVETGTVALNAEGAALLAQAAEAGELKMRVTGKYQSYDIIAPAEELEKIAAFGQAAVDLLTVEE